MLPLHTDAYGTTQKTQTVATNNPYAYTSREFDDEDLYYYRARYYDPSTQRFLSEDPIGYNSGDFNFYRYVANNPNNLNDPSGLWIPQAIGAAIGLAFEGYNQYSSGNFNLGRLAMAGLTGAWGGFGGFAGGIARGALGGAANNGYQQLGDPCSEFDPYALARAGGLGGLGGAVGGGMGAAGAAVGGGIANQ